MNPQHSSPAPAASRCRDALQVSLCTRYKSVHLKVYINIRYSRHIVPNGELLSCSVPPSEIGDRRKYTETVFRTQNIPKCSGLTRPLAGCSSGSQRRITPIDKHIKFNRMNGSPGDPPANRMHISKQKGITPVNHRLASDPFGKEAGWETTT
jgi:hypothetical protein